MSDFYNKYPYTDFHELNLDWVIERVKKLTDDWLATHEEWVEVQQDWADTEQAWIDFKAYVENYLANLDVQDEIDHKINAMILDGSFETIIRPTVVSQTIATTTDWLAAHITQPTTPAIDTSLTIPGAAADAAIVGINFDQDEAVTHNIIGYTDNITFVSNKMVYYNSGYQGTISGNSITPFIPIPEGVKTIIVKNAKGPTSGGDNRGSAFYTNNTESSYISGVQMLADGNTYIKLTVPSGAKYFRSTVTDAYVAKTSVYFSINDKIEAVENALAESNAKNLMIDQTMMHINPSYESDKYIQYSTGYAAAGNGLSASDFIRIPIKSTILTILNCKSPNVSDQRGLAFYNYKRAYISGYQYQADGNTYVENVSIPAGAYYMRFTVPTVLIPDVECYFDIYNTLTFVNELWTSMSTFKKIAVIGDSFASGEIYVGGSGYDYYDLSWIQVMARQYGVTAENYSAGGLTTRSWLTSPSGLTKMNANPSDNLYILALGINDYYSLGLSYLGTIADIDVNDYTQNADTFYGNYGKIISLIMIHSPNAKIVMSTMSASNTVADQFNEAIINIANLFGIPYIVQRDDAFFTSSFYASMVNGHPVAVTYGGMAQAIARLLDKAFQYYMSYFNDYVG